MKNGVRTKIISLKAVKLSGGAFTAAAMLLSFAPTELTARPSSGSYSQEKSFQLSPDGKTLIKYLGNESEVIIPQGITKIGDRAFDSNRNITRVVIPDSVTKIERMAFRACVNLKEINLPANLKKISYRILGDNPSLTKVVIPDGVTEIGAYAFYQCEKLTEINIPYGVKKIDYCAFLGCRNLNKITIPDSVISIGNSAFAGCSNLKQVTIPDSVKEFGKFVLHGIKSVKISNSNQNFYIDVHGALIDRKKKALLYYPPSDKAEKFTIPDYITNFDSGVFYPELKEVTLHARVSTFERGGNTVIGAVKVSPDNPKYYTDDAGALFDRDRNALIYCPPSLEKYTIPKGIKVIAFRAFATCFNLKEITIPNSVTVIENYAFAYCRNLKEITIPDSVDSIRCTVFSRCDSLTRISIGKHTEYKGFYYRKILFRRESGQRQTVKPETKTPPPEQRRSLQLVQSVPRKDFQLSPDGKTLVKYTGKSAEVIIPAGVTVIGTEAFANCQTLVNVTIPDGVTHIYASAFANCINLKQVSIPSSVVQIRRFSFSGCTSLKSLIIPANLTSLGRGAFTGVKAVYVSGKNKHFYVGPAGEIINSRGKQIVYCRTSTSGDYTVPDGIKSVLAHSFQNCRNITSIKLPDGIKTLGQSAFQDCTNLRTITIPDSVSVIGAGAFSGCSSLKRLNLPGKIKIGQDAFPPTCKIICR